MMPETIHTWLEENEPPFVVGTIGGRSYTIPARSNFWIPEAYPAVLCVALTGRGIIIIRMATIESLQLEHEMAVRREWIDSP
jgi:hypothetical protein